MSSSAARRRRFSEAERRRFVEDWRRSGLSQDEFPRRAGNRTGVRVAVEP